MYVILKHFLLLKYIYFALTLVDDQSGTPWKDEWFIYADGTGLPFRLSLILN